MLKQYIIINPIISSCFFLKYRHNPTKQKTTINKSLVLIELTNNINNKNKYISLSINILIIYL